MSFQQINVTYYGDRSELLPGSNFSQSNASAGVVWRGREIKLNLYNHMELNSDGSCVHENANGYRRFRVNISAAVNGWTMTYFMLFEKRNRNENRSRFRLNGTMCDAPTQKGEFCEYKLVELY